MHPDGIETCGSCSIEVPPQQAQAVRTALDHMTIDQRGVLARLFEDTPPALLCAACFNATLSNINTQVLARQSSETD